MLLTLDRELEAALSEQAHRQGVAPEILAIGALRQRFLPNTAIVPRDEWERRLLEIPSNCGTAISDEALSSEGLYE